MKSAKTLVPNSILDDKQYKLYDFCEEFSKFRPEDLKSLKNTKIKYNKLNIFYNKGHKYFRNAKSICPDCKSSNVVKNGYTQRKLIFIDTREEICYIQKYKCNKCGKTFYTDLISIVDTNKNITKPVFDSIFNLYSIFGDSVYKIQYALKKEHNIDISHQTIENALLNSGCIKNIDYGRYSGYYLFDTLWVKIYGKWKYLLALFDVKLNTIVSYEIVNTESEKIIHNFLSRSTRNKNKYSITTDLKKEYRNCIYKLGFKHQFCMFHTKQKLNRDIHDYLKANELEIDEIESIKDYKKLIFSLLDTDDIEIAKNKRDTLINNQHKLPEPIFKILWKFILPYFKNLTYWHENFNIERTNNKIENIFQKLFPKSVKKKMKIKNGVIKRFGIKLTFWDERNVLNFIT